MTTDEYWHTIAESYREKPQEPFEDAISRQAAIDAIGKDVMGGLNYAGILTRLPSVTPKHTEITLESAIDYLNSIGWMQEHDRILTESAQSVTPKQEPSNDAISRTRAMETFAHWAEHKDYTHVERHILHAVVDELRAMPSIGEEGSER